MRLPCWLILAGTICCLGCHEELYHGLDERAANLTVASLHRAGIPASKRSEPKSGFTVSVPAGSVASAMQTLESEGLPPQRIRGMQLLFEHESLVPSPAEERARVAYAAAQEVRRSLSVVDGVLEAHVNLVLPEERRGLRDPEVGSASVVLNVRSANTVDVDAIRRIVSSAVPSLSPAEVEVLLSSPTDDVCAAPEPGLTHVGPFVVSVGSKRQVQTAFAALLSILALLGLSLIYAAGWWRPRRRRR